MNVERNHDLFVLTRRLQKLVSGIKTDVKKPQEEILKKISVVLHVFKINPRIDFDIQSKRFFDDRKIRKLEVFVQEFPLRGALHWRMIFQTNSRTMKGYRMDIVKPTDLLGWCYVEIKAMQKIDKQDRKRKMVSGTKRTLMMSPKQVIEILQQTICNMEVYCSLHDSKNCQAFIQRCYEGLGLSSIEYTSSQTIYDMLVKTYLDCIANPEELVKTLTTNFLEVFQICS